LDKKFRSILDELSDYAPSRDRDLFIESRAQQVIASAVHLIKLLKESYDPETADDLSKRLLRAISSNDEDKFRRRVRAIRESRETRVASKPTIVQLNVTQRPTKKKTK
jgi:hypothetical protein